MTLSFPKHLPPIPHHRPRVHLHVVRTHRQLVLRHRRQARAPGDRAQAAHDVRHDRRRNVCRGQQQLPEAVRAVHQRVGVEVVVVALCAVVVLGLATLAATDAAKQVDGRPNPVRVRHLQLDAHGVVGVEQGREVDEVQLEAFGEARQEG